MDRKRNDLSIDEMLELRRRGVTLRKIGEMCGVSRQRVHQLLGNTRALKPKKANNA
jgi:DNA-directed RNA polymerase sigma subunit (sigma70/sigma32)